MCGAIGRGGGRCTTCGGGGASCRHFPAVAGETICVCGVKLRWGSLAFLFASLSCVCSDREKCLTIVP